MSDRSKHDLNQTVIKELFSNHCPVFLVMIGLDYKTLFMNDLMLKATGYTQAEVIDQNYIELFIADDEKELLASIWGKIAAGQQITFKEYSVLSKKGQKIPVLWYGQLTTLPSTNLACILGIGINLSDIKNMQKTIKQNEHLLNHAIEQMPIPVIMADAPNAKIKSLSKAAVDLLAQKTNDIKAIPLDERREYWPTYYSDGSPFNISDLPLVKAVQKGIATRNQEMVIRRGDSEHWVSASASPLYDDEGNIIAGIVAFPEVTEQKKAYQFLAANDKRHRLLLQAARAMSIMLSSQGNILSFDSMAEDLTGYHAREVMGKNFAQTFLAAENHNIFNSQLKKVLDNESVQNYEVTILIKGGFKRHVIINAVQHNLSPEKSSVLIACQDITALRLAEKSRKETEISYKELFSTIASGVIVMTPDIAGKVFIIKDINTAGTKLVNRSRKKIINHKLLSCFPELKKTRIPEALQAVLATGKHTYLPDCRYNSKDLDIWFDCYIYKLPSGDIVSIFSDLTEQKKAEAEKARLADQLRQSRKMQAIGQLAGGVAHDFNNLLAGILGCTELVLSEEKLSTKSRKLLKDIIKTTEKGQDLTKSLMSFSRFKDKISVETNIHELINHVINILEHTVDKSIIITHKLEADKYSLLGDPTDIENSLLNIALNARDAMPNGGCISFKTSNTVLDYNFCRGKAKLAPGHYLQITISDTGNGIPEHILDKIFDPFFTTKPEGEGTGLGLSSVFGCIQAHNGYVTVDSSDKGSTFIIYLPAYSPGPQQPSPHTHPGNTEIKKGEGSIILVEDEDIVREVTTMAIDKLGYQISPFASGIQALEYYKKNYASIDLVILDMVMPKMNGLTVFKKMKEINNSVKAVIVSGHTGKQTPEQALTEGVLKILEKPLKTSILSQTIAEILTPKDEEAK